MAVAKLDDFGVPTDATMTLMMSSVFPAAP
jgi:hypothetical protein